MSGIVFLLVVEIFLPAFPEAGPRVVRVGIYQNPPKVFLDEGTRPRGIFVDILEDIARTHGWRLEYRPGTWNELLRRLESGDIDILPDVARSAHREERILPGRTWVLESWVDVFSLENRRIRFLADLEGRRIAVLAGSVQEEFLSGDLQDMGIRAHLLSLPDYAAMVRAVLQGEADALAASRFFYFSPDRPVQLVPNHLVIHPGGLYFGFCRSCQDLAEIVDVAVARMKNDPASAWYSSQARWLDRTIRRPPMIPEWARVLGITVMGGIVALVIFVGSLRRQVKSRTHQLQQANERLARTNRDLEETLAQLQHSRVERERLDREIERIRRLEMLGQLAGGIAHDFNNQLMAIHGLADLALSELPEGSPVAEDVRSILDTTRRGMDLTAQLLAFARRQPTHPQLLDVNVAGQSLLKMLRQLVGSRIQVVFRAGGDVPPIRMDPAQFDQILTNLVVNARDAITETGTIEVSTSLVAREDEGTMQKRSFVRVEVTDDGCGIPPEIQERIFEPFFTTKPEGKGTGLGLSTVFGIVRRHDGFIRVDSVPGKTTFTLDFPVYTAASNGAAVP